MLQPILDKLHITLWFHCCLCPNPRRLLTRKLRSEDLWLQRCRWGRSGGLEACWTCCWTSMLTSLNSCYGHGILYCFTGEMILSGLDPVVVVVVVVVVAVLIHSIRICLWDETGEWLWLHWLFCPTVHACLKSEGTRASIKCLMIVGNVQFFWWQNSIILRHKIRGLSNRTVLQKDFGCLTTLFCYIP